MKMCLLYYRGSGPIAAFIRSFTKSRFAHVAPAILLSSMYVQVFDAYWSRGVSERIIPAVEMSKADHIQWLPFDELRCADKGNWLGRQVGKPYDKLGIIALGLSKWLPGGFHLEDTRQGAWICSRLAEVAADYESEVQGLTGPPSPEDIYLIGLATRTKPVMVKS